MRENRHTEVNVLGYRIERIHTIDEHGERASLRYDVLAPESGKLLGSFAHRAEAERDIIARELTALPRAAAA